MAVQQPSLRVTAALTPDRLRWGCDPRSLEFESTNDVTPLEGTVGQKRSVDAINFGLAVEHDGFNVFVAGPLGSGRTTSVTGLVKERNRRE